LRDQVAGGISFVVDRNDNNEAKGLGLLHESEVTEKMQDSTTPQPPEASHRSRFDTPGFRVDLEALAPAQPGSGSPAL